MSRAALVVVAAVVVGCAARSSRLTEAGTIEFLSSGTVLPADLPFSEAVRVGGVLYLSGQIGLDPATGRLVPGGLEAEARQTMRNIRTVLRAHGYAMRDVVQCTVMLADVSEWAAFNDVYRSFFTTKDYPARSAFGANGLALGARVEVECIAARDQDSEGESR